MGIFGKLVSIAGQVATSKGTSEKIVSSVENVISNKMVSKCEEELKELEVAFELEKQDYIRRKSKIEIKAQQGDVRAIKKLQSLENAFKITLIEYEGDRNVILAKYSQLKNNHESKIQENNLRISTEDNISKQDTALEMVKCNNCGQFSPKGVKFCCNCGTEIQEKGFCSNCGTRLNLNSNFCPNCGNKI